MKKKLLTLILIICLLFTSSITITFAAVDNSSYSAEETTQYAYDWSLERVNAAYDYLNATYLDTNLGMYVEYATQKDIETLQKLADDITKNCTTDEEKCYAIYNWMDKNVKISFGSYSAIDVFRTMTGVCSGHAQLMSALMKLSGIRAAIVRGYYEDTTTTTFAAMKNGMPEGHQWVMAYYNNDWYLFDDLWSECGNNNREAIAKKYFIQHVDGISICSDTIEMTKDELKSPQTIYKDGEFINSDGNANGGSLSLGGCLRYSKSYYSSKSWGAYYAPLEGQVNNKDGYAIKGGYYSYLTNSIYYVKENGITLGSTVVNYNNNLILINGNYGVKINESIDNNGLTNGNINMYLGETIDFSSLYKDVVVLSLNKNVATIDGLTLTAKNTGIAEIVISYGVCKVYFEVKVYGDSINSKSLFKDYCDHINTHVGTDDCEYCDYCGKLIKKIEKVVISQTLVEEPQEQVVENTHQTEPIVEEQLIVEQPKEEVIVEQPKEEQKEEIIEQPKEEVVEQEVVEQSVEESVQEIIEQPIQLAQVEEIEEVVEQPLQEQSVEATVEEVQPLMVAFTQTKVVEPEPTPVVEQQLTIEEKAYIAEVLNKFREKVELELEKIRKAREEKELAEAIIEEPVVEPITEEIKEEVIEEVQVEAPVVVEKSKEEKLNELLQDTKIKISTQKLTRGIKITVNNVSNEEEIKNLGYTLKYKFYRYSDKACTKSNLTFTTIKNTYTNTKVKRGTRYYYRVSAMIYDGDALVTETDISQSSTGIRKF